MRTCRRAAAGVGRMVAAGAALGLLAAVAAAQAPAAKYPQARKGTVVDNYFGTKVADPYRWMEDLDSAEVKAWVEAENEVTSRHLASLAVRDELQKRITDLWNYPKVSVPSFQGGRWFYSKNTGLQRQSVVYSRPSLAEPATVVLDPNQMWPDGRTSLAGTLPSPDAKWMAYGQSEGGSDWSTWRVRSLEDGTDLADTIRWVKFSGFSWTEDAKGFFYGRYPEPPAGRELQAPVHDKKIYYHVLGTPQAEDRLIYERPKEPALFISAGVDETRRYLFIDTNQGTSNKNELFVKDLGDAASPKLDAPVVALYAGHTAKYDPLGVVDGTLYLLTDRSAPNGKVVSVPLATADAANWTTVVPAGKFAIQSARLIAGRLAVNTLEDVAGVITFYNLDGTQPRVMTTPGLGVIGGPFGRFGRPEIFYSFASPLFPLTVYQYDIAHDASRPFEPPRLTFDPDQYETVRGFFNSKDGARVPVFITHKKGLRKDGANPTMLYGYGGFDSPTLPSFRPDVPAWLERGGVWATASLRGGSEYGEAWHEAGMKEKKQNVFDDFIGAAEFLIRQGYASPSTLGIMGASNGGLLAGAVMEQRPDLFAVALPAVGVMDMLRYQKFSGGAAWATEYGSSEEKAAFGYLSKYSPLHNVKAGACYPATLVTTADHDDRVVPSHSFKFTAALQAAQGCDRPVLIRVETSGSHGYRPTDRRIAELADQWAFAWANMKATTGR